MTALDAPAVALADEATRTRIASDLDTTLFVDAGAGSGKTTVLVDRIVALVGSGVPLRHIAAVTFTEKAAAELRDRLRESLEVAGRVEALGELDGAAIGTLHSFARRILSEHPIRVGLPPLVEVLDEVGSQVAADRWWRQLQTELLDDPTVAPLVRLGLASDMQLKHLRELVVTLEANWDLVEERLGDAQAPPPPRVDVGPYLARARTLLDRRRECRDPSDKLLERFDLLETWLRQAEATDDDAQLLDLIDEIPGGGTGGKAPAWGGQAKAIREQFSELSRDGQAEQAAVMDRVIRCLLPRLARAVLEAADDRVRAGRLRFHDLLVLARRLVRSAPDARAALQDRYRRLLLDEAQDTDPIQVELSVRIAGGHDAEAPAWEGVVVPPGSLFFVGDAKQSIYRFRRADIGTYLGARQALGDVLSLTTNFRSSPAVLDWINTVFGRLIVEEPGVQPKYTPLDVAPARAEAAGSVTTFGAAATGTAEEIRTDEARDIASLIVSALTDGWTVGDRGAGWAERPVRPDDVTILLPARTAIFAIEAALDAAGVPYRTEAASIVYSATEVRELMTCLRAVDDPTDELAVVATLRSSLFGCSDVELWRWRQAGGSWNLFARRHGAEPVGLALDELRDWSRARSRLAPAELLDLVVEQRRVLEVAVDSPRYREVWRRLRFVVDQARAWSEAERGSLREYLAWAARQADDSVRVTETVLPETDTRTVRITTIHASKGLQFPFVIVAGLASRGYPGRPTVLWPSTGGVEVKLSQKLETAGYGVADVDEQAIEYGERLRLLYVACTRAESRLAVSLHRKAVAASKDDRECVPAEVLDRAGARSLADAFTSRDEVTWRPETTAAPVEAAPWEAWSTAHAIAVDHAAAREAISATAIAHGEVSLPAFPPGLVKDPVDLELPPWRKGRYGEAVGRAVHAVLQTIDLATGAGLRALAESQALAEGVLDAVDDIEATVQAALDSELIQRAAAHPHWRETYVGTMIDGKLIEGYVDLLFRADDGLVLVDYKTDADVSTETIASYERQLQVYQRVLADAVGEAPAALLLVFPRPSGTVVHQVETAEAVIRAD